MGQLWGSLRGIRGTYETHTRHIRGRAGVVPSSTGAWEDVLHGPQMPPHVLHGPVDVLHGPVCAPVHAVCMGGRAAWPCRYGPVDVLHGPVDYAASSCAEFCCKALNTPPVARNWAQMSARGACDSNAAKRRACDGLAVIRCSLCRACEGLVCLSVAGLHTHLNTL